MNNAIHNEQLSIETDKNELDTLLFRIGEGDPNALQEYLLNDDQITYQEIEPLDCSEWSKEDFIEFGKWVLGVLDPENRCIPISKKHITRLHDIGMGPTFGVLRGRFESRLRNFRNAIGSRHNRIGGEFSDWTFEKYEEYVRKVTAALDRKPTPEDYDDLYSQGLGPNFQMISREVGLNKLHPRTGYPTAKTMVDDDLIDLGVDVMMANPDLEFNSTLFYILSPKKVVPNSRVVERKIGWAKYKRLVEERFADRSASEEMSRKAKLSTYSSMIDEGLLPESWSGLSDDLLLETAGKKQLIANLSPTLSETEQAVLASKKTDSIVTALQRLNPTLTLFDIEEAALDMDIFSDLWPEGSKDHLRVSKEDLENYLNKKRIIKRASYVLKKEKIK